MAMYDHGEDIENSRSIKMALMGPLAGIGNSIAQFGLAPLFSTIFAGLAMNGLTFAPMAFWITMIISMLTIKLLMGYLGYKLGTSVIDTLSEKIGQVSHAAGTVFALIVYNLNSSNAQKVVAESYVNVSDEEDFSNGI